ncbi:MAG: hypothetical protein M3209_04730 [Acidobacteriota bacterium]|nr:hypothetical protein [Acidobacteriota bacterium]
MNINRVLIMTILIIVVITEFACTALAQKQPENGDGVVVTGKYQLKQSDINRLTEIYEWMFAGKFSAAQRKQFQALIIKEAQVNNGNAKSIISMLQSFEKIQAASVEKREQIRQELVREVIAALEKEPNETNDLLLEVYRGAQGETANKNAPADDLGNDKTRNQNGAIKVADLAGIWSTSSVSTERYRSLVTGELSDPSGSIIEYKISPNGEIKHVGYLSTTVYSCTTKLFISRSGRISISGSNITFDFAPGKRMYQTCSASASRNDTLPAERKTYPFRLERDEYGLKLCTLEENGKDFCIRKKSD